MKQHLIYLFLGLVMLFPFISKAQNVGIGTTNPHTTLEVAGGFTIKDTSLPVAFMVNIPPNVSNVSITGTSVSSSPSTFNIVPPTPLSAGQMLTIFNKTVGYNGAKMNGYIIPQGQYITFISTGTTAGSFLPGAIYNRNVRTVTSSPVEMSSTDHFVKFSTGSSVYYLGAPFENTGRVVYFFVADQNVSVNVISEAGGIVNTGTRTSSISISLQGLQGGRTMLISDGQAWIRMN